MNKRSSPQRQKTVAPRREENYALKFFNEEILMSKEFTAVKAVVFFIGEFDTLPFLRAVTGLFCLTIFSHRF
ncbi:MAG: hypothetical protein ACXWR4_14065, partial [Bdellovibrionota bacterium]